jgi:hypothetical protein
VIGCHKLRCLDTAVTAICTLRKERCSYKFCIMCLWCIPHLELSFTKKLWNADSNSNSKFDNKSQSTDWLFCNQMVSCWHLMTVAKVQSVHVGFMVGKVALVQSFCELVSFLCQFSVNHNASFFWSVICGWYSFPFMFQIWGSCGSPYPENNNWLGYVVFT